MNIFERHYKEYDSWYDKNEYVFATELNTVRSFSLKGRGVEIGVGTGRFAQTLNISDGIEPSLNMLRLAKLRGVNTVYASGESAPYEDNTFDYAVIVATLCFVKDPDAVFRETYRILKSPGMLVAGILQKGSDWVRYYMNKDSRFYSKANFYSPGEVIELFNKTGFSYQGAFQALFKGPGEFTSIEAPLPGYDKGSFVVLGAGK